VTFLETSEEYINRAIASFETDDYESPPVEFNEAIRNDPDVYYKIGNMFAMHGYNYVALAHYIYALDIDPGHKDSREALAELSFDTPLPLSFQRQLSIAPP